MLDQIRTMLAEALEPHDRRHARIERQQRVILQALHVIIAQRSQDMSATTDAIKAELASFETEVDAAIAAKASAEQAAAAVEGSDVADIKSTLDRLSTKVGQLVPAASGQAKAADSTAPISAVVTAPTLVGTTTIPVAQVSVATIATAVDAATAAGSSVSVAGAGIAPGTTVDAVDTSASTITVSDPTIAAHAGDGTETLTVTPAAV